ncbi:MAG: protein phosphatase CheZ [Aquabacterium sp.]|nr:protein phosphatase CheZ [Aquabacterium sp.]
MSNLSEGRAGLVRPDDRIHQLGGLLVNLGLDTALHQLTRDLPDARDRLAHVGQMTEDAAMKVLNMVDENQPTCLSAAIDAQLLSERLSDLSVHPELGVGEARAALAEAAEALRQQAIMVREQNTVLTDIMLAQDFQDLSGQVIKKVMAVISHTEQQLQQLLPPDEGGSKPKADAGQLAGPQTAGRASSQQDVDDMLASLGF